MTWRAISATALLPGSRRSSAGQDHFNLVQQQQQQQQQHQVRNPSNCTYNIPELAVPRGLHSSTSQLNLSRVCHKTTPYTA